MKRSGLVLLAMVLGLTAPYPLRAQDEKSPDLQQQKHPENNPPSSANQPNTTTGRPSADKSPDTQQDQNDTAAKSKSRKRHKNKNGAGRAHDTASTSSQ